MKIVFLTDIHLSAISYSLIFASNIAAIPEISEFFQTIKSKNPDALFITGDIGDSESILDYLHILSENFNIPIYFTLGNHDYYGNYIFNVEKKVEYFCKNKNLIFLDKIFLADLTGDTCVIGQTGIADAGFGHFNEKTINDYKYIKDYRGLTTHEIIKLLQKKARKCAETVAHKLHVALGSYQHVYLLTHVPPWREAATYEGMISDDTWAPHMVNRTLGIKIQEIMDKYPDRKLTVLCGHSHGGSDLMIADNIHVISGHSVMYAPSISGIIEI